MCSASRRWRDNIKLKAIIEYIGIPADMTIALLIKTVFLGVTAFFFLISGLLKIINIQEEAMSCLIL